MAGANAKAEERSHVEHRAARFLEADEFLDEAFDYGKPAEDQDEQVKAAQDERALALVRLRVALRGEPVSVESPG